MKINYLDMDNPEQVDYIKKSLEEYSDTVIFMLPQFLQVVRNTYNFKVYYLTCDRNNELTGIASFYEKPGLIGRKSLESVPGGVWTKDSASEKFLIDELKKVARKNNLSGPYFKDLYRSLNTNKSSKIVYRAVLELPKDEEQLTASYSSNLRRKIRKAKRNGLVVRESKEIDKFYHIWAHNMRDLGTPVISFTFFRNIKEFFELNSFLLSVEKGNECIGGVILLKLGDRVIDPYISCLRSTLNLYPNNLLYHEMLLWGIKQKCRYFDLGRSQPGSGNEKFKLQYGAKLRPLYSYGSDKIQVNSLLGRLATSCWKKMPLPVTNSLGPKIRRCIPFA